ncbi:hypothetical protein CSUI_007150, partial [Cystoisospora suis]
MIVTPAQSVAWYLDWCSCCGFDRSLTSCLSGLEKESSFTDMGKLSSEHG